MASGPTEPATPAPAGFWARYAAWSLDAAYLLPPALLLSLPIAGPAWPRLGEAVQGVAEALPALLLRAMDAPSPAAMGLVLLVDPALRGAAAALERALLPLLLAPMAAYALLALCWALPFECSRWQATPGKRLLGLAVARRDGGRPGPLQVLGRVLAAGLSWLSLNIGHALAVFAPRHEALHDRLSGTRVLRHAADPALPGWARGWLALQAIAALAAMAWAFLAMQGAVDRALQQVLGY